MVSKSRSFVGSPYKKKKEASASFFFYAKPFGAIAKRLCNGLQIRLARFDSGSRLQIDWFFSGTQAARPHGLAAFLLASGQCAQAAAAKPEPLLPALRLANRGHAQACAPSRKASCQDGKHLCTMVDAYFHFVIRHAFLCLFAPPATGCCFAGCAGLGIFIFNPKTKVNFKIKDKNSILLNFSIHSFN